MMHLQCVTLAAAISAVVPQTVMAQPNHRTVTPANVVIENYYAALDAHRYLAAYRLWSNDGAASGTKYIRFRRGFAATARTRVVADAPTNGNAGAGSSYVDVPVDVYSTLRGGVRQHFRGTYTLRRVNDVSGATASQLQWRITSAKLRPVR